MKLPEYSTKCVLWVTTLCFIHNWWFIFTSHCDSLSQETLTEAFIMLWLCWGRATWTSRDSVTSRASALVTRVMAELQAGTFQWVC